MVHAALARLGRTGSYRMRSRTSRPPSRKLTSFIEARMKEHAPSVRSVNPVATDWIGKR